jgi:hypothetical protein
LSLSSHPCQKRPAFPIWRTLRQSFGAIAAGFFPIR